MSPLLPDQAILPSAYAITEVVNGGVSVPSGTRVACLIGEGARSEILVSAAAGNGNDGLNSEYTSTTGRDGRHFALTFAPVISNRTQLFKNGIPLNGVEEVPNDDAFSNRYDYRIDIETGQIELHQAYLIDQGGKLYSTGTTNVGLGALDGYSGPNLLDVNAPSETWTIKCISVQRDSGGDPVDDTARFIAYGSVSGNIADANGNPVVWIANGQDTNNGILQFAIAETKNIGTSISPFREGDYFTIRVKSGVLTKNDSLTSTYISVADLNDPQFFDAMQTLAAKHGNVSLDNTLSLGASLAFANSTPGVLALQAAPARPRRTSYILAEDFDATSTTLDDFVIPLPLGVTPDLDTEIHFFVTDTTSGVETQLLPNKFPFYTLGESGQPTTNQFVFSDSTVPAGYSFSYSVNESLASLNFGNDGYLDRSLTSSVLATFSIDGTTFDSTYIGKQLKIFDAVNHANNGTFEVIGVSGGDLQIEASDSPPFPVFINETSISFHVIHPVTGATIGSSTGTDGALASIPSSSTGTFSSSAVNFTAIPSLTGMKLIITAATNDANEGRFDIVSVDGSDVLTISKCFNSEDNLQYEVLDPDDTSSYVVINHNIIPDGNDLRVTIVDNRDADFFDAGWLEAFEVLETQELDILVALPTQTISVIQQNALNHCITMSNARNKKERVLFTGAIQGLTPENLTGAEPAAVEDIGVLEGIQGDNINEILAGNIEDLTNYSVRDSFGHTYRCLYCYPDEIVVQIGGDSFKIAGLYLAAAAAGFVSGTGNLAMPMTNKVVSGFTILRDKQYSITTLENLVNAGVCIFQPVAGGGRCVWSKTTAISGFPEDEEMSIIFIRDRIAKSMRIGFGGFIGLPDDGDMIAMMTTRALGLLKGFISQGLITDFTGLSVKRNSVDPRQVDVAVLVQVVYPINWILIKVGIGTI